MPFYLLSALAAGIVLSFALPSVPPLPVWAAAFCCAAAVFWRRRRAGLWAAVFVAGALWGVWRTEAALDARWPSEKQGQSVALTVHVAGLAQDDGRRVRVLADALADDGRRYRVQLADFGRREWPAGSTWRLNVRLRAPVGEANLRGFDREAWALANGIDALGTAGAARQAAQWPGGLSDAFSDGLLRLRERISASWQRMPPEAAEGAALMRALAVGEQDALENKWWQAFRPLGLNHLVSVSGLHVTMVAVLFGWLAHGLLRLLPAPPHRPRAWVLGAGAAAALFYTALAGFAVPTVRSLLMIAAVSAAWLAGGTALAWRGWWFALAAVLFADPAAALSAGSWLSFGLVAALLWTDAWRVGGGTWYGTALRAQWAATLATVPAAGRLFSALPAASPLANAPAIPWFSWILVPLALAGSLLPFYPLQYAASWLGGQTLHALAWAARYAPEWGVAAAPLPLLLLACAACAVLMLPRGAGLRPWAALVLAGFVFYRPAPPEKGRLKTVVIDVGQGLSVSFQTASHSLIFDTGTAGAAQMQTLPALRGAGVRRPDILALSHHDADHDGGAPLIAAALAPRAVLAGQPQYYPQAQSCRSEAAWEWDGVRFEWLDTGGGGAGDNGLSCVLRVVAGGTAVLVTGDLDARGEAELIRRYGAKLRAQVLVLGHHGSKSASSGAFLNTVAPDYAVASAGFGNPYGHPAREVQTRLSAHGITLLRTDRRGAWQFDTGGNDVFARPAAPKRFYWQQKPFDD